VSYAGIVERNRVLQIRLAADAVDELTAAYRRYLRLGELDRSFSTYASAFEALVNRRRSVSAILSAREYEELRRLAAPNASRFSPMLSTRVDSNKLRTSLLVTGPVTIKTALTRGVAAERAYELGLTRTLGAATRHILDGGRDTTWGAIQRDRTAVGWQRVSDGSPCAFCAMLVSRGAVYKSGATAGDESQGGTKFHDGCACRAVPLFRRDEDLGAFGDQASKFRELYESGGKTLNGLRRELYAASK
jgi:hypothetical protein